MLLINGTVVNHFMKKDSKDNFNRIIQIMADGGNERMRLFDIKDKTGISAPPEIGKNICYRISGNNFDNITYYTAYEVISININSKSKTEPTKDKF